MKRRVIVDCDPGIDDALAIIVAGRSPELFLEGVTTVAGNVALEQATGNALRILDGANRQDVLVYPGEKKPLKRKLTVANRIHGKDGLGDCDWPASTRVPETKSAVDYLVEQARAFPGELTLICLGPLTNIAQALRSDPEAMGLYRDVIIVGGAARVSGNVTPVGEFNFWTDPEAAKEVIEWAQIPLYLIGLDVARKAIFTPNHREFLKQLNTPLTTLIYQVTRHFLDVHWELENMLGCVLNDPLAVLVAAVPEIVRLQSYTVDIATDGLCRGQLVVDYSGLWKKHHNVRIAVSLDEKKFIEELLMRFVPAEISRQEIREYLGL